MTQLQRLAIAPSQLQGEQISLLPQQQHYLSRVLRLQAGDRFIAMNGQGDSWLAKLEGATAQILESISLKTELPVTVTLMVALPKNGFDEIVRQATELGVTTVIPIISDRTRLNPSPQKLERWRRIAGEAAEQSFRPIVPEILNPVPFSEALLLPLKTDQRYICVTRDDCPHLLTCLSPTPLTIATGPEGGWTPTEVENAIANGFQPVTLGRRILRAVTAPITALSIVAATIEAGNINYKG